MALETELKLSLPPQHFDTLRRHPLLRSKPGTRATTKKLYNIYYDTPTLALHRNAMAVRLRRVGKQWLQTMKSANLSQAGLHQRNEWEMPVKRQALEPAALIAAGANLPAGVAEHLQPVFSTDFSRTMRVIDFGGAEIELCLDSGAIIAGKRSQRISEVELELKSGDAQQLFSLALALLESVPLAVEHISKAEYGYQLLRRKSTAPAKAKSPALDAEQSTLSALQAMIDVCLQQLHANVKGATVSRNEEYLHQVRVAMRRLRVVLAMAEHYRQDDELRALYGQVSQLCIAFGELREWDVFATQTLARFRGRESDAAGLDELLAASERIRARHRAEVVHTLKSSDYQRFELRFGTWMFGDYWRAQPDNDGRTLIAFARHNLDKRGKRAHKLGRDIAAADPAKQHRLRIACKKLRYSSEMFSSLFDPALVKPYLSALSGVQDILGVLNDLAVAHKQLEALESRHHHDLLARMRVWLKHDRAELNAKLATAWKQFAECTGSWK